MVANLEAIRAQFKDVRVQKKPLRPRPDLNIMTICYNCKSVLRWSHILRRHQASEKCKWLAGLPTPIKKNVSH